MTEQEFKNRYKVVGEWAVRSQLLTLKDHSHIMTDSVLSENSDHATGYYAIYEILDDDSTEVVGEYRTPYEAWEAWDRLKERKVNATK